MENEMSVSQIEEKRLARQKERFANKSRQIAAKYLYKLEELPGAPNQYQYFHGLLKNLFVDQDLSLYENDKQLVGTYCVMVPQEILYAIGAQPIKLCSGNYVGFQFGDDIAPRDACPLVKAVIGNNLMSQNSIYDACQLFIVPITCDCKKKMADFLKEYKPTVPLHVPINKSDDAAMACYVKDLYEMAHQVEDLTGTKLTRGSLLKAIRDLASVQKEIFRFITLKGNNPPLIRGTHGMAIMNSYAYDDAVRWGQQLKVLNDELELRLKNKTFITQKKLPRILLTGSPITYPNLKIPLLIEEMGGIVAADETCMGDRGLYDPVALTDTSMDGMMRALANRYIAPCSCPVFSDNEQRLLRIKQMIKDHEIDGVIYHVLRGCLVYDYEYQAMEKEITELGLPIIRVESDYNEEDIEQLRIRMEAFIEMIKFKR